MKKNKKVEYIPLEWDTNYFGYQSAKIILLDNLSKGEEKEVKSFIEENNFITIVNENNNYLNNYWLGSNTEAYLTDINVQLKKRICKNDIKEHQSVEIKNKFVSNQSIMRIAKDSFKNSRFFNDPNIPEEKAAKIYENWVNNSFDRKDKYFVVFKSTKLIIGFILFSKINESATIELIAVDENHRGERIGETMLKQLEMYLARESISYLRVGTQLNNLTAINFYTKNGFKYNSNSSIYHLWRT